MAENSHNWDESLFLALNNNHSERLEPIMLIASNVFSYIPVFVLIAFFVCNYYQRKGEYPFINTAIITSVLLVLFFFSLIILPPAFSFLVDRDRPCLNPNISEWVRLVGEECDNTHAFFAAKPCIIFCITSFLFFTIKDDLWPLKLLLIFWSIMVAYSRIYVGAHYPVNVMVGSLTGILLGFLGNRFYLYLKYNVLLL